MVEATDDTFVLAFSNPTASCGEQICFEATVNNFTDLISFQYSIIWDTDVLQYIGTQNYQLQGLNENAFFTPQDGVLRVSWFDVMVAGVTVTNGTPIFQICFDVVATTPTTTRLEFANEPIPVEVVDNQSNEVTVDMIDGELTVINCGSNTPIIGSIGNIGVSDDKERELEESIAAFSRISIYPNPAREELHINLSLPFNEETTLQLFDTKGYLVKSIQLSPNEINYRLPLNDITSGLYLIKIQSEYITTTKRIIKQ